VLFFCPLYFQAYTKTFLSPFFPLSLSHTHTQTKTTLNNPLLLLLLPLPSYLMIQDSWVVPTNACQPTSTIISSRSASLTRYQVKEMLSFRSPSSSKKGGSSRSWTRREQEGDKERERDAWLQIEKNPNHASPPPPPFPPTRAHAQLLTGPS
jgi:hypothetical protein